MAMMLSNFLKAIGLELDAENAEMNFKDADKIGAWAKKAIVEIQRAGIVNGKNEGIYDPKGNTTRAEAAKVVAEVLKRYLNKINF
jgi:hypothetical protein